MEQSSSYVAKFGGPPKPRTFVSFGIRQIFYARSLARSSVMFTHGMLGRERGGSGSGNKTGREGGGEEEREVGEGGGGVNGIREGMGGVLCSPKAECGCKWTPPSPR